MQPQENMFLYFMSDGGLLKTVAILSFFIIATGVSYEVILVGNHDPLLQDIFFTIAGIMANALGFSFGHASAMQSVLTGVNVAGRSKDTAPYTKPSE